MDPNGHPVPALWQEARNTDGRVYYYNVQTKATQWTKPKELMTPVEVCEPVSKHCELKLICIISSRWQINRGKSTLLMLGANTGTTRKTSRAHGRFQKFTKMRWRRRLPQCHPPSRACGPFSSTMRYTNPISVHLPLLPAVLLSHLSPNIVTATTTTAVIAGTDTTTDVADTDHTNQTTWRPLRISSRSMNPTTILSKRLKVPL
jgi:hypothetical protein